MQTITLQFKNADDFHLLIKLAERLGIHIVKKKDPDVKVVKKLKQWKYLGAAKMHGQLDNINLRDFIYD